MNRIVGRGILMAAVLLAGAASLQAVTQAMTTVETFNGSGTLAVTLPGTVGGGGTTYGAAMTISSLSTTASGTGTFTAGNLDTASQNSNLPKWTYSGHFFVPATSGPATVTITGAMDAASGGTKIVHVGSITVPNIILSSTYSPGNIAISSTKATAAAAQVSHQTACAAAGYSSTSNIATQVSTLSSRFSSSLTNVDSANGLIDFIGSGAISTTDTAGLAGTFWLRFGPGAGLGLMLVSLLGIAALRAGAARPQLVLQPAS